MSGSVLISDRWCGSKAEETGRYMHPAIMTSPFSYWIPTFRFFGKSFLIPILCYAACIAVLAVAQNTSQTKLLCVSDTQSFFLHVKFWAHNQFVTQSLLCCVTILDGKDGELHSGEHRALKKALCSALYNTIRVSLRPLLVCLVDRLSKWEKINYWFKVLKD